MDNRTGFLLGALVLIGGVLLGGCDDGDVDPDSETTVAPVTIESVSESIERVSDGSVYFFRLIEIPEDERVGMAALFSSAAVSFPDEGCITVNGHVVIWPWETRFGPGRTSLIVDGMTVADGQIVDLGGGWVTPPGLSQGELDECGGKPFIAAGATPTTTTTAASRTTVPSGYAEQISEHLELITYADGSLYFYRLVSVSTLGEAPDVTVEFNHHGTLVITETGCVTLRGRTVFWPPGTEFERDGRSLQYQGLVVSEGESVHGEAATGPPAEEFFCLQSDDSNVVQLATLSPGPGG